MNSSSCLLTWFVRCVNVYIRLLAFCVLAPFQNASVSRLPSCTLLNLHLVSVYFKLKKHHTFQGPSAADFGDLRSTILHRLSKAWAFEYEQCGIATVDELRIGVQSRPGSLQKSPKTNAAVCSV
jgi:hypothetical protein